jgi:hypothetical protein
MNYVPPANQDWGFVLTMIMIKLIECNMGFVEPYYIFAGVVGEVFPYTFPGMI